MKTIPLIAAVLLAGWPLFTQPVNSLELTAAYGQAIERHPLGQRATLLGEATAIQLEQIDAGRLPEINLMANARLQSENVKVPFQIPGEDPFELPLFIAQTFVEAQYLLYDGGLTEARRQRARLGLMAEEQGVKAELAGLKERVNQSFFAILRLRAQQEILLVNLADLQAKIRQLEAGRRHGAVLESAVDQLRIEALRLESALQRTQGGIGAAFATLSDLIGEPLDTSTHLAFPDLSDFSLTSEWERPELEHFALQQDHILAGEALIAAERRPRLSAFAQGGFGYPNPLNFFDDTFSPYALVGLRFQWRLFDWNKNQLDRQLMTVQSRLVENRRAAFEHTLSVQEAHFQEELATLEALIRRDLTIVELQESIRNRVSAQLNQGVITPAEYLDQVNDGIRAALDLETHRLQLQELKVNYLTHKGLL